MLSMNTLSGFPPDSALLPQTVMEEFPNNHLHTSAFHFFVVDGLRVQSFLQIRC